jgi:phosphoenolpyruvate carboxykinase (ATP)
MFIPTSGKTSTFAQAEVLASSYGLENHGLTNLGTVYWNLPTEALYEEIVCRREGSLTQGGPVIFNTGKHNARAASDKFVVREPSTEGHVWWGKHNRAFDPARFDELFRRMTAYLQNRDVFVQDCYVGADPEYRMPVRIVTELAWHSLFARNMFIRPETADEFRTLVPGFTVMCCPGFQAAPEIDGTASSTFIVLNFAKKLCIIGNTGYGGEIKKSIFTVMNYLLPLRNVFPMHCSANVGKDGDVAIFFGLSGTGKTSLSADPLRALIGDDEHGWSANGVFNFEGGCYAKVIRLSPTAEPEIYATTRRFGTILENVVFDPTSRLIDLDDATLTENTRASYPLDFIANAKPEKRAGHPKNVIFLTCDASGVMPPISKLTVDQARYQFISGYTSKIAGTEVGLGKEPQMTFSTCFGAPFMVHQPDFYARLLKENVVRHGVDCWLVNTGWIGGPPGVGNRISIKYTRALLNAALSGKLTDVEFSTDPVFGFQVPKTCPDVPDAILDPAGSWSDRELYKQKYRQLAARFIENFKEYDTAEAREVAKAGPRI